MYFVINLLSFQIFYNQGKNNLSDFGDSLLCQWYFCDNNTISQLLWGHGHRLKVIFQKFQIQSTCFQPLDVNPGRKQQLSPYSMQLFIIVVSLVCGHVNSVEFSSWQIKINAVIITKLILICRFILIDTIKAWSHECRIVPHRPTHGKRMPLTKKNNTHKQRTLPHRASIQRITRAWNGN